MENLNKSMKLSIIYGFIGAVIMPLVYEIYANVSTAVGIFIIACWVIFVGIKFSSLKFREAFVGITCTVAYSGILGFICYMFIHPKIEDMLWERSVYFQLSLREQLNFVLYSFLLFMCMYLVWTVKFGVLKAIEKIKSNGEKAEQYIDNAFDDGDEQ